MEEHAESRESRYLFERMIAGDDQAAEAIFRRYFDSLLAFTRKRISKRLQGRFDADDVVNSAYRSFFMHARNQEFVLSRSGDLWRLLIAITHRKLLGNVEFHSAQKRSPKAEKGDAALAPVEAFDSEETSVALEESLERLLADLAPADRKLIVWRLQGESTLSIAQRIGVTERSVRRKLQTIRDRFEQELLR